MQADIGLAKVAGLARRQEKHLSVHLVKNGYVISPSYPGETAIAKTLNEMLDEVQAFFEDKPEQPQ